MTEVAGVNGAGTAVVDRIIGERECAEITNLSRTTQMEADAKKPLPEQGFPFT